MSYRHLPDPVPHPDYRYESAPIGSLLAEANPKDRFDDEMLNPAELTMEDVEEMYGRSLIEFARTSSYVQIDSPHHTYSGANYMGAKMAFAWNIGRGKIRSVNQTEYRLEVFFGDDIQSKYVFLKGGSDV